MSARVYSRNELVWRGDDLCSGRTVLVSIVWDATWPSMWRVLLDGKISDMTNRTRAKEAALTLLNQRMGQETREPSALVEFPARRVAGTLETASNRLAWGRWYGLVT
jgi:hypothetical protein